MDAFDRREAEAFRIFCRVLAVDFSCFFKSTVGDAKLSPFFRNRSAKTFVSFVTRSEAHALVRILKEKFGAGKGVEVADDLINVLDALNVFHDCSSAFRDDNLLAFSEIPEDVVRREVTTWYTDNERKFETDNYYWGLILDEISIGESDKDRRRVILFGFQKYIVQLNSTIQIRFKGVNGLSRVIPSVHFVLLDAAELSSISDRERFADWFSRSAELSAGLGDRERDMFLRAAFLENDFVIIPIFDSDSSAVRLVVVSFSQKVRYISFLPPFLSMCLMRVLDFV